MSQAAGVFRELLLPSLSPSHVTSWTVSSVKLANDALRLAQQGQVSSSPSQSENSHVFYANAPLPACRARRRRRTRPSPRDALPSMRSSSRKSMHDT